MAKFRFQLEAVLEQRRGVERGKQLAVATCEAKRLEIEGFIRACQNQLAQEKNDLRNHLVRERSAHSAGGVDMRTVRAQANAALQLVGKAQQAVFKLAGVHHTLDAARRELIEATTRRRAVEVLKERRYEAWKQEQERREVAALDEMAIIAASRGENNQ